MSTPNLPINYQEELMREAQEISKRIAAPSGDRIKMDSHGFTLPDGTQGDELAVVVVDFISSNLYYDRPYNKDNPIPPACFAIGPEPTALVPSENSPEKQADTCAGCPLNQFGSALTGKGKACKNTRLLAVVPLKSVIENDPEGPLLMISVPPTSLKTFDGYVSTLAARFKMSPIGVGTKVTPTPNVDYACPKFESIRPLAQEEIMYVMSRREEARRRLQAEPDITGYEPPAQRKKR
jgi:hypothetical protein